MATSQPLAAQAGICMLQNGGNAADAAVAAAIALTVVEPTSNGLGSDAFALIWDGCRLHGLNASGRSPEALRPDTLRGFDSYPTLGWLAVTVPGAVSAWRAIHKRFGSLPFEHLFEPAIRYARHGFIVSPMTADAWQRSAELFREFPEWQRVFAKRGRAPEAGELIHLPDHVSTLVEIAATAGESFYRGRLAETIAAAAARDGGLLSAADMASHEAEWVEPISIDYRDLTLHEIPPNGQGLAALLMLGILRRFDLQALDVDGAGAMHLQIEAMKLAFADAHRYIADRAFMDVEVEDLLDPGYLKSRAKLIDPGCAQDFSHGEPRPGGTVYLTAADADGRMVSFIQSNYMGFGSGVVVPGTGIAMQNRAANFSLEPGHPNQVAGRKRPYHTIIPGFATRTGDGGNAEAVMSFGVMGGFMQPQGHAQVLIRLADYGQNPQAILDAPRWRVGKGLEVEIEPGFDASVYQALKQLGHDVRIAPGRDVNHGRGQIIHCLERGYLAASDPRADGGAVGF